MNLKKIIIHEIKKEPRSKDADVKFSNRCLNKAAPIHVELATKLIDSFRNRLNKLSYSSFDYAEKFPSLLKIYLDAGVDEAEPTEADFLNFSKQATNGLYEIIQESAPAKGGFLVFAEYNYQQQQYVSVFLVRDSQNDLFKMDEGVVHVEKTPVTDTNKLAMACSINVANFLKGDNTPLMMINKRTAEVSEYFSNWLGSKDKETSEEFTELLHQIITHITPPEALGPDVSVDDIRQKVFNQVAQSTEGDINLDVISKVVYQDEDLIRNYILDNNINVPTEFKAYRNSMKKFVEINVKNDGMILQFARGDFNRKIRLGEEEGTIIIKSKSMYDQVKKEYNELAD